MLLHYKVTTSPFKRVHKKLKKKARLDLAVRTRLRGSEIKLFLALRNLKEILKYLRRNVNKVRIYYFIIQV